jgi:hypothetical protein
MCTNEYRSMEYFSSSLSLTFSCYIQFKIKLLIPKIELDKARIGAGGNTAQRTTKDSSTATKLSTYSLPTNGWDLLLVSRYSNL